MGDWFKNLSFNSKKNLTFFFAAILLGFALLNILFKKPFELSNYVVSMFGGYLFTALIVIATVTLISVCGKYYWPKKKATKTNKNTLIVYICMTIISTVFLFFIGRVLDQ